MPGPVPVRRRNLTASLLAAIMTAACIPMAMIPAASAAEPIVIAQSNDGLLYGPLYVAIAKKFIEAEGLAPEVIVLGGGAKAMSAVLAGSAQIYIGAPFELINAVERGQHAVAFAQTLGRVMINLTVREEVAKRLGITATSPLPARIAAMRGLKLGISSPKSSGEALYRNLLIQGGLDPERDVDLVPVGAGSTALAAFLAGKVDMYTFSSPFAEEAVSRAHGVVLFDMGSGDIPGYAAYPYISLIAREDWLEAHADTAHRMIRALAKAMTFMQTDREATRAILRSIYPRLEQPTFDAAFEVNMRAYPKNPAITPKDFATALAEYALIAGRPVAVTPEQLATNKFVTGSNIP